MLSCKIALLQYHPPLPKAMKEICAVLDTRVTGSTILTAHSSQLTAHSSQLTAHSFMANLI